MLFFLLAATVAAAPDWTLLAFPRGARDTATAPTEPLLADAAHLDVFGSTRSPDDEAVEPPISGALFQQMLEETLRQRGLKLEMRPQSGLLLARGEAAAIEVARGLAADLDRQTAAFDIDIEVTLRGAGAAGGPPVETTWRRRVPAGTDVFFGSRATRPFVAGFEIQVAQDAGQAEPHLGNAAFGTGVHLRATRLGGGARVFVDGVFDSAVIASVDTFDPDTPDLGVFEQPHIELVQVAFAGTIASGATLDVRLADAGPARGETFLSVRATARKDAAGTGDGWVLVDMSGTSFAPRPLEPVEPGLALRGSARAYEPQSALLTPPTLASMLDADRSSDGRGGRSLVYWSRSMLALPRSETARIQAARALVGVAEDAGSATRRVELVCDSLRASFPVAANRPARLVVGTERVYLTDYGLEVAPQIWMPSPHVERAFDGIAARVFVDAETVLLDAWRSTTPEVEVLDHDAAQMGKLQLPQRSRVAGSARTATGESPASVFDAGAPLTLAVNAP